MASKVKRSNWSSWVLPLKPPVTIRNFSEKKAKFGVDGTFQNGIFQN
jgi:hypothetical protein